MAHEQVLELVAAGALGDLAADPVADVHDLAGRQHVVEAEHQVAGVPVPARRSATSRWCRSGRRPANTGRTPGRPDRSGRAGRSSSLSLSMLMPVPTVTVRLTRSSSWISFIRLTSTTIPPRSGTAPSVSPVPPSRGTTGIRRSLAIRTTAGDLLGRGRQHRQVGQPLCPAVHRERRGHPGPVVAVGLGGQDLLVGSTAHRRDEASARRRPLVEHVRRRASWPVQPSGTRHAADAPDPRAADSASSSCRSTTSMSCCVAGRAERPFRPGAGADQGVDVQLPRALASRLALIAAVSSGFSIGRPPPPPEQ